MFISGPLVDNKDHIFYTGAIKVLRHGTLGDNITGTFPSDHLPKVCDFLLEVK